MQLNPEQQDVVGRAVRAGLIAGEEGVLEAGVEVLRLRLRAGTQQQPGSPDEWMRRFREWAHSHSTETPLLSDEAISRDSIYRERGL